MRSLQLCRTRWPWHRASALPAEREGAGLRARTADHGPSNGETKAHHENYIGNCGPTVGRLHILRTCENRLHRRCAERAACRRGSRHAGHRRGGQRNSPGPLRGAGHHGYQRRRRPARISTVSGATTRCLAATFLPDGCRRQCRHADPGGQCGRPSLGVGQGVCGDRAGFRACRQRYRRGLAAHAGRQARQGEDGRFPVSGGARRYCDRQTVGPGVLRRTGPARLLRRLLHRRTHGNDGGGTLPHRLRRDHRGRSCDGLPLHTAALFGGESSAVVAGSLFVARHVEDGR
jgi:hypothetical protein